MEVININPKETRKAQHKEFLLKLIEDIRMQIEQDEVCELVVCSMTNFNDPQVHTSTVDPVVGIGLFELGKSLLLTQHYMIED